LRICAPDTKFTSNVRLALDVVQHSLIARRATSDYFYASRLKAELAEGVNDIHFHPVEPRRCAGQLVANF
jgi:hypothetical protein